MLKLPTEKLNSCYGPTMKSMDKIVSLCKERGFLFQSSEIYGGIQGFWDYGPLGVELKRNLKEAWWSDMIAGHNELVQPSGAPSTFQMVGLDCTIIMHPQVWKCSGHYDLFHDHMVDCRESKKRYRFDQLRGRWAEHTEKEQKIFVTAMVDAEQEEETIRKKAMKFFKLRNKDAEKLALGNETINVEDLDSTSLVLAPDAKTLDTLTEPREFNLMFKTTLGALGGEEDAAFLRPETAQGIFVNFKNVVDTSRVKIPFGIGQAGKSFRNEITPRNFTFRSREFEQMEIEFFCHPDESQKWYQYWRDRRMAWYQNLGLSDENLIMREHHTAELAHYSVGTADIEYAFPFLPAGEYGELEGIAHRGDFDLRSHMEGKLDPNTDPMTVELGDNGKPKHKGSGRDLAYRDAVTNEKFVPHVIEPSAGADRGVLAFLCEAFEIDEAPDDKGNMQERTVMRLHPRLAPIKAAVLPLVKKDEALSKIAKDIYGELKEQMPVFYDEGGAIGRRYRRQDASGTPFCITVDTDTVSDQTVTIRERDSLEQTRVKISELSAELRERIK